MSKPIERCGAEKCVDLKTVFKLVNYAAMCPGNGNNLALRWASEHNNEELVKFLLAHKDVNPSDLENDAIYKAARFGHVNILKLLVSFSAWEKIGIAP